jgi:undecaprenyl-phosphate galactose phosphotransferase
MVSDILVSILLFYLSVFIRINFFPLMFDNLPALNSKITNYYWIFPIWFFAMTYEGAYSKRFSFWDEIKLIYQVTFLATLIIFAVVSIGKLSPSISRAVLILMGLLFMSIFPFIRISLKRLLINIGLMKSRVLILGAGKTGRLVLNALRKERNLGYEVAGFIDNDPSIRRKYVDGIKVHGYLNEVERYLKSCFILEVVVAMPKMDNEKLFNLVSKLQHKVRSVLFIPDPFGIAVLKTELKHLLFNEQAMVLEIKNNLARPFDRFVKRTSDYLFGLILALILLLPILIVSIIIRITSKGQAIFKQERVGKDNKVFLCYKFRTMYQDAEKRLNEILETDPEAKSEWDTYGKLKNDPRITGIGNLLRVTSLDELPQIFNVLKGEMSLVGPRPIPLYERERYQDMLMFCFSVLPGITGLWQVSGRSGTSYKKRISLDSWYIRNWNLWLDIVILLKTIKVVFRKEGAV